MVQNIGNMMTILLKPKTILAWTFDEAQGLAIIFFQLSSLSSLPENQ